MVKIKVTKELKNKIKRIFEENIQPGIDIAAYYHLKLNGIDVSEYTPKIMGWIKGKLDDKFDFQDYQIAVFDLLDDELDALNIFDFLNIFTDEIPITELDVLFEYEDEDEDDVLLKFGDIIEKIVKEWYDELKNKIKESGILRKEYPDVKQKLKEGAWLDDYDEW